VSVPNIVAGLGAAHVKFGRLPWSTLTEPAAALARDGIVLHADLERSLALAAGNHPALTPDFRSVFFRNREPLRRGVHAITFSHKKSGRSARSEVFLGCGRVHRRHRSADAWFRKTLKEATQ